MRQFTLPVVILAGGKGTRLQSVLRGVPKPMAPIGGRPFLDWLVERSFRQGAPRVILSIGHLHDVVTEYFGGRQFPGPLDFFVEPEPRGTGGAIDAVMHHFGLKSALIINGDTFFMADFGLLQRCLEGNDADAVIAVRRVDALGRYGAISVSPDGRVLGFSEKRASGPGLINGGVYALRSSVFADAPASPYSLELEIFERRVGSLLLFAVEQTAYFIDIGIPEDYERACREIPQIIGSGN